MRRKNISDILRAKKVKNLAPFKYTTTPIDTNSPGEYEGMAGDPKFPPEEVSPKNYKKLLTIANRKRIVRPIINLTSKKDDKKMAKDKTKTSETGKVSTLKSIAWLVEAGFRGFVGWVLLSNFDRLATTVCAVYALGTAGLIVVSHFVRANR